MSSVCYADQNGSQYCVSKEAAASQSPVPGYAPVSNAAAQEEMWQARSAELRAQWEAFDPEIQSTVVYEMGLEPQILDGFLPRAEMLVEMVALAQIRAHNAGIEAGWADAEALATHQRELFKLGGRYAMAAAIRVETALDRYRFYAHQGNGTSFWGWFEKETAEAGGGVELPSLGLKDNAETTIARLQEIVDKGDPSTLEAMVSRMQNVEFYVNEWVGAMNEYIQGREDGGAVTVAYLTFVRDSSAALFAAAASGGSSLAVSALWAGGAAAGLQGVTELAAVQAGVQDGNGLERVTKTFVVNGLVGLFGGAVGKLAMGKLGARLAPKLLELTGKAWAAELIIKALEQVIATYSGAEMEAVLKELDGKEDVTPDELAATTEDKLGVDLLSKVAEVLLK